MTCNRYSGTGTVYTMLASGSGRLPASQWNGGLVVMAAAIVASRVVAICAPPPPPRTPRTPSHDMTASAPVSRVFSPHWRGMPNHQYSHLICLLPAGVWCLTVRVLAKQWQHVASIPQPHTEVSHHGRFKGSPSKTSQQKKHIRKTFHLRMLAGQHRAQLLDSVLKLLPPRMSKWMLGKFADPGG